ncbi:MAG TPA: hypothetical protein PKD90_11835 [Phnomibacter sp.]|nr:hypothetical protein [Phnomibacter sp.]
MKTLLSLILLSLFSSTVSAKVLRVGFFGPPIANTDYSNLTDAITAATAGDTVYCFPGSVTNSAYFLTKRLTLIGYGNWLSASSTPKGNANQQAFAGSVTIGSLFLEPGSSGSAIMGFNEGTIYLGQVNDIVIRRNRNLLVYLGWATPNISLNNIQILENYMVTITQSTANFTVTNLLISNNLIGYLALADGNSASGIVSNNIWAHNGVLSETDIQSSTHAIALAGGAFLFQNNIIASFTDATPANNYNYFYFTGFTNTVFNYNVMIAGSNATSFPPSGTGNIVVQSNNAQNIFEGFPGIGSRSADDRWVLKAGSPALVANRPGSTVNAGIFGGANPYKLSTIPPIPTIYQLSSPSGSNPTGNSIQINVSTRSNN